MSFRKLKPYLEGVRALKVEIRADGAHIEGYVNVTEKKSRPVITPRGKVIEVIEQRAFEKAIERAGNITVTVDHDKTNVYASTSDGTLDLYEDAIGLHASVLIRDPNLIDIAKQGKIKGWSFGMYNVIDDMEDRAGELPIRHVKSLDLDHLTLVVNKQPIYSATSVELRANESVDIEERASEQEIKLVIEPPKEKVDYSPYQNRIDALKVGK
ncbi:MAG: HK97 family phage prohead protease [Clostridia bacterium]|nr:HK97 family phage prohead protease [Clostridia bacterium]